ncbi:NAD(P)H-binding protein [Azoarcus indigens]|uniref:Uncharacterized protein YbjT (DUF2867 family) n=1 Tax=Azoarcus indigens TaxID=29545 RepID=A0A4V3BM63_9RHOO|nr:SDR family oxidoreductase [Azoarcus indigens]NMG65027.1 NAD(P)H-binding protein [Azoarcus indigens]TDN48922.1 uncharacterized protein YbjT (DUF2867 family) [Azoarcus indigens]
MRIMVCGAGGFLGGEIAGRLEMAGHEVLRAVRRPARQGEVEVDFGRMLGVEDWLPLLRSVDAVVNAAGILMERGGQRFDAIHHRAPAALFAACARSGVSRVLQISALGVESGQSAYFTSKLAADTFLMSCPIGWQVLRPGLVYGPRGKSASFFRLLASSPLLPLPSGGKQPLRAVHIDDVAEAALRLLDPATPARQCVALVGAEICTYRQMLAYYRAAMGFPPAWTFPMPAWAMRLAASLGEHLPGSLLTRDTLSMLEAGNTTDDGASRQLLQRPPRGVSDFVSAAEAETARVQALASWRPMLLRLALAAVWLGTALVCLFVYPRSGSLALLADVGLQGAPALAAFHGAVLLDLGMGLATLFRPGRRLWLAQMLLVAAYSIVIAIALPAFLAHPFGPVLKNLPILAILFLLYAEERRP